MLVTRLTSIGLPGKQLDIGPKEELLLPRLDVIQVPGLYDGMPVQAKYPRVDIDANADADDTTVSAKFRPKVVVASH